jgi:hypothetical protein
MKECSDGKEDYVLEGDVIVAILQNWLGNRHILKQCLSVPGIDQK